MEKLFTAFFEKLNEMRSAKQYEDIWNYDEVGVHFESGLSQTVAEKGGCVSVMSTNAHGMRMTCILCIAASGIIAPPVLLFHNSKFQDFTLEGYPDVKIISNSNAYNNEDLCYHTVLPHFLQYVKNGSLLQWRYECPPSRTDSCINPPSKLMIEHFSYNF